MFAGLRLAVPATTTGSLVVDGDAVLTLAGYDRTSGLDLGRHLRVRLQLRDRLGWLVATPEQELRMVSADVDVPLDGAGAGTATVTLHDARVFGQSWERLVLGTGAGAVPVLPEARTLLAAAVQRLAADASGAASVALHDLLEALGLVSPTGGLAADALDQLVHDPGGLVRQRLAAAGAEIGAAVTALLGPVAASVDLDARTLRVVAGDDASRTLRLARRRDGRSRRVRPARCAFGASTPGRAGRRGAAGRRPGAVRGRPALASSWRGHATS